VVVVDVSGGLREAAQPGALPPGEHALAAVDLRAEVDRRLADGNRVEPDHVALLVEDLGAVGIGRGRARRVTKRSSWPRPVAGVSTVIGGGAAGVAARREQRRDGHDRRRQKQASSGRRGRGGEGQLRHRAFRLSVLIGVGWGNRFSQHTDVATATAQWRPVRISAKEDYALRAALELALADGRSLTRDQIAQAQGIPTAFLQNILSELRAAGLVETQRGREGGFRLARPAGQVTIADVVRAVSGPLATVRGRRPSELDYRGSSVVLEQVWVALRVNVRAVLEHVSLADLAAGTLPAAVAAVARGHEA
jgi:Rrf2 family protein